VTKDDHFYIDPYVNYEELCSNPEIEFEAFIEQLQTSVDQSIFGTLESELKDVLNESVETFKVNLFLDFMIFDCSLLVMGRRSNRSSSSSRKSRSGQKRLGRALQAAREGVQSWRPICIIAGNLAGHFLTS
jgi:hypothetical protein